MHGVGAPHVHGMPLSSSTLTPSPDGNSCFAISGNVVCPQPPPPPPSPSTPPLSLPSRRRLGTDSPSDGQELPPSFDLRRPPNSDGSYPWGDGKRKGGFNTSNSFHNGNGHYSGSTKAPRATPNPSPSPSPSPSPNPTPDPTPISGSTKARDGGTPTGRYPSRRRLDNGWSWHDCHQHWHYDNYAHYALRDLCTNDTVAWEDRAVVGHKNGWCVTRPICIHMHLHLHLSVYYTYAHPIHAPATVPATVQADVAACKHAIARARANTTILTPYLLLWPHPHPSIV